MLEQRRPEALPVLDSAEPSTPPPREKIRPAVSREELTMKPVFLEATLVDGKSLRFISFYRTEMGLVSLAVESTSSCCCISQP